MKSQQELYVQPEAMDNGSKVDVGMEYQQDCPG